MYVITKFRVFLAGSEQTTVTLIPAIMSNTNKPVKLTLAQVEKLGPAFKSIRHGGTTVDADGE